MWVETSRSTLPNKQKLGGDGQWFAEVRNVQLINLMLIRGELSPVSRDTQHEVTEAASGSC